MNKKVYCKNCRYKVLCGTWGQHVQCAEGRVEINYNGNKQYLTACEDKNKNCDCKDYKRKWWKFWIEK